MESHKKKDEIQSIASDAWIKAGKIGTVELATGTGKNFCSFWAIYRSQDKGANIQFLAEATGRKKDIWDDMKKFKEFHNIDIKKDYKCSFHCYQSAYKWKTKHFDMVVADEIHDSLSEKYSEFYFNNSYDALIGLSATVDRKTLVSENEETGEKVFKGDLLDKIAPVVYTYSADKAREEGVLPPVNIFILYHRLNSIKKNIPGGNKKKPFLTTEQSSYDYRDKCFKKACWMSEKEKKWALPMYSRLRAELLYSLPSKVESVKSLLSGLKGRTLLFANSLDSLLQITPNVISSRNKAITNSVIRESFDKKKTNLIGSFKALKQGSNLVDLDNVIIYSYYSTDKDLIQRMGRLRFRENFTGNVIIYLTMNTQEEVWFKKMMEATNIEPIYCHSVDDLLTKYNNLNK